ncbi:MAG: hypothetical protein M1834_007850 [Cirrosporium novae-zelandiae]|nr:MAG: hypothetical protein M1834_007850 [Cirrosporium novae-zelandiae]
MKAVRYYGKEDIRVEEIEEPKCGPGLVKLKPGFAGICGTDLHEYHDGANICPTKPHGITGEKVPVVLGHEFSGTIEEIGAGVEGFKVGQNVAVFPIQWCGKCPACKRGLFNDCEDNGFYGLTGWGGGMAQHLVCPPRHLIPLGDVPLDFGAVVEPLAVAWHSIDLSPFQPTDTVLVLGAGPIGLALIQSLKAKGATKIIVSEMAARRQKFAKEFGAMLVLDPSKDDVVAKVKEATGGDGAEIAFDAAGVQPGLNQAFAAVKTRGTVVNVAIWPRPAYVDMNQFVYRELHYMGIATYLHQDFREVVQAISEGKLNPEPMITARISMDEVEEKGFKTLINDKANHVKILVDAQR